MAAELLRIRYKAIPLIVTVAMGGALLLLLLIPSFNLSGEAVQQALASLMILSPIVIGLLAWSAYRSLQPIVSLGQQLAGGESPPVEHLLRVRRLALTLPLRFFIWPIILTATVTLSSDFVFALLDPEYRLAEHLPVSILTTVIAGVLSLLLYVGLRRLMLSVLVATSLVQDQLTDPRFTLAARQLLIMVVLTLMVLAFLALMGYAFIYQHSRITLFNKYQLLLQTLNQHVFPFLQTKAAWIETMEEVQGIEGYGFILDDEGNLLTAVPFAYRDLVVDWSLLRTDSTYIETAHWAAVTTPVYRSGEDWVAGFVYRVNPFATPLLQRALVILGVFSLLTLGFVFVVNRSAAMDVTRDLVFVTGRLNDLIRYEEVNLQPLPITSHDEVGDLVRVFNRLQERLKLQQAHILRERKELLIMQGISQRLNSTLDIMQILQDIITIVETTFGFRNTTILLLEENEQMLYVAAGPNYMNPDVRRKGVPLGQGIVGYAAATGGVYLAQDVDQSPHFVRTDETTRSELAIPLRIGERVIGVFNIESDKRNAFSEEDVRLLTAVAHQAALALHNAQLYRQAEQERRTATLLAELARMVNSTLDLQEVLDRGLEQLEQVVNYDTSSILLLMPDGKLQIAACRGFEHPEMVLGASFSPEESNLSHETVRMQRPVFIPDVQNHPSWGHNRGEVEGVKTIRSWIGIPLSVQGQGIGLLTVDKHEPDFYTPEDVRKASLFAAHLATAVHNARLYEQMQARARDLGLLLKAAERLSGLLDVRRLLREIVEYVHETFGYPVVAIYLMDETTGELSFVAQAPTLPGASPIPPTLTSEQSLVLQALQKRQTLRQEHPAAPGSPFSVYTELAIPLFSGEQVIGIFHLACTKPCAFNQENQILLTALANQVAVALQNARLYERVQTQAARLSILQQVSQSITSILDPRALMQTVVEAVTRAFAYPHVGVFLLDPDTRELYIGYQVGYPDTTYQLRLPLDGPGITVATACSGKPVVCNDVRQDPRYVEGLPMVRSELAVPLIGREGLIGVLNIETQHINAFTPEDVELFTALGQQVAVALENAHLFASVSEQTRQLARLADTLAQEKRKLDVTLQTMADGLLVTAPDGTIVLANPAAEAILGRSAHQMVGQHLGTSEAEQELRRLIAEAGHNPKATFVTEITLPDRRCFKVSATAAEDDPSLGVVLLLRDITRERELDRLKTDFITTVSHEMRTPLTSVLGFARVTAKVLHRDLAPALSPENARAQEALARALDNLTIIQQEAQRLNQLANDVLDIARIESGQMPWHDQPINSADIVQHLLQDYQTLLDAKQLRVVTRIEGDLKPLVIDPDRFRQVLANLLSNAIKFSPAGETIIVTLRTLEPGMTLDDWNVPEGGALYLSVTDRGPGIAPDLRERLFKRFQQLTLNGLTDKPQGTGLGLAICHEIVTHYQGKIGVDTVPGHGSTFYIALPWQAQSERTSALVTESRPRAGTGPLAVAAPLPVLMVGRLSASLQTLRDHLRGEGIPVLLARSGTEGIALARQHTPALIILTTQLTDLTAFDVLQILKTDPVTLTVPVLLLVNDEAGLDQGRRRGADLVLLMPVADDLLQQHVRTLLRLYRGTQPQRTLPIEAPLVALMSYLNTQGFKVQDAYDARNALLTGQAQNLLAWLNEQLRAAEREWQAVRLIDATQAHEVIVLTRKEGDHASGPELA